MCKYSACHKKWKITFFFGGGGGTGFRANIYVDLWNGFDLPIVETKSHAELVSIPLKKILSWQ
jgi:hypothetical protein